MYNQDSQTQLSYESAVCMWPSAQMVCQVHNHQQRATSVNLFQRKIPGDLQSGFERDIALGSVISAGPTYKIFTHP